MFLKKCASRIREATHNGKRGYTWPAMDLSKSASHKVTSNIIGMWNTTMMVVTDWVLNGKDMVVATQPLHATCTDVRYQEELSDFLDNKRGPK
jgi:hypothetical protein